MADDQTNPYTMMGMMGMMQPNKYLNPMYQGQSLPMPGYYGDPTDASGQKIQSFQDTKAQHDAWDAAHPSQGTTLTSTPQTSQPGQLGAEWSNYLLGGGQGQAPSSGAGGGAVGMYGASGRDAGNIANLVNFLGGASSGVMQNTNAPGYGSSGGATGGGTSGGGTNPFDMRQAYLTALSDPQGGKPMPVQGATVPQSQPLGTPSVMSAFLQAHPSGASTGSYSNKPFFDTLNQLQKGA